MITQLSIDEVGQLLRSKPEQSVFDWKTDFTIPNTDENRGEFIKDLAAVANGVFGSYGFILYGVDPRRSDPIIGITEHYDDARLQQLVSRKIEPPVEFLYYEVAAGPRVVAVVQVAPTRRRPHIIRVDLGKVRKGQILVRRGSSTDGATIQDLLEFFYGSSSGYFPSVVQKLQLDVAQQQAHTAHLRELRAGANDALRDLEITWGVPPGSLGAKR